LRLHRDASCNALRYNTGMSLVRDLIKDSEEYKKQIEQLSTETIVRLAGNRQDALEQARKLLEKNYPNDLIEETIEAVADEIQMIAKMIWEERTK